MLETSEISENSNTSTPFYLLPEYLIRFARDAFVTINNVDFRFCVQPETFKEYEDSAGKMEMSIEGQMLVEEYNVNLNDCGTLGIELNLAFQHILRNCKEPKIPRLRFFLFMGDPDTQKYLDHGVPENVDVEYLYIHSPPGFNPRVHERLNYDYLSFYQTFTGENTRIYQTINEKMLKAKFLALSCFLANPEVLSSFEGWGLLVNYSHENKIDKSLIESVIENWIKDRPVRRFTALFDSHERIDDICPGRIMSNDEVETILEKLRGSSSNFEKEDEAYGLATRTRIRFTRKSDDAKGELFMSWEDSNCIGMAFLQPPDEDMAFFLRDILRW